MTEEVITPEPPKKYTLDEFNDTLTILLNEQIEMATKSTADFIAKLKPVIRTMDALPADQQELYAMILISQFTRLNKVSRDIAKMYDGILK